MSKIDLIYNYRAIDTVYVIYGPEKVNGNIVVSTEGYIVNSISEVINKINAMVATLSPEITNCQSISSGLYGNMNMQIWRGDLASGSSSSPDYTQILTNINSNLSDISSKLKSSGDNKSLAGCLERIFNCFNATGITLDPATIRTNSLFRAAFFSTGMSQTDGLAKWTDRVVTTLVEIRNLLKQSVSPNASITDVISALNATIDSKQDTTIVNNDNTNLVQVEGVLDYRLKPQDSM